MKLAIERTILRTQDNPENRVPTALHGLQHALKVSMMQRKAMLKTRKHLSTGSGRTHSAHLFLELQLRELPADGRAMLDMGLQRQVTGAEGESGTNQRLC